ncbi:MAG: DNA repair protein RadA [Chloroflexi bacterium RBG_16_57_9]|nr:MAG: DNA repair protein RadA [Chloroflexi bacterium RBG_16_57_9]
MPKSKTAYVCQQCGHSAPRWAGRCPDCGEWNSLVEMVIESKGRSLFASGTLRSQPQRISDVTFDNFQRLELPLAEFSRVLGGGIVPGSMVLIGGDPGIGKSTLLLQVAILISQKVGPVLYVSGEESVRQIKMRADRLAVRDGDLYLLAETQLGTILEHIAQLKPQMVVVDSIQAVYLEELESTAGSVSQVRECANRLMSVAKTENVPMFLVSHVTKAGAIAGPRVLEHIVDTVLYLEGERFHSYRLLRGFKNRFGSTNEVGVFEMRPEGMVEVENPSEVFLAERLTAVPGSTVAVTLEGTRPLLVEVQALTSPTNATIPRRTANGIDYNRLLLLIAVLTKRVGLKLDVQDVFVNVVGGLKINEPAVDLGVATSIASSARGLPVAADLAIMGEIGLSGELRSVTQVEKRLNEVQKLGFKRCLLPKQARRDKLVIDGVELIEARSLGQALEVALAPVQTAS